MKRTLLAAALAVSASSLAGSAMADNSTLYAGFAFTFGGGPGVTVKYLSTNNPNDIGVAGGVTYNFDGGLGCDLGLSSADNDIALVLSYDICKRGLQISGGLLTNPQ